MEAKGSRFHTLGIGEGGSLEKGVKNETPHQSKAREKEEGEFTESCLFSRMVVIAG